MQLMGLFLQKVISTGTSVAPSGGNFLPRTFCPLGANMLGTTGSETCCQMSGPSSRQVSQPGNPGFLWMEGSATKTKEQSKVGQE